MKKGNFLKVLCGAAAATMLLTACGGATNSTPASGSAAATSDTTLTYWSMWNSTEGQAKVIQEAADAYEAKTGIKINIEWKGRDVKKLVGAALDAGEKIDFFDQDYIYVAQQAGKYCADLTDMVAASGFEEHALPILIDTAKSYNDGVLKVIPYQPYTTGVWYNKAMFEAAGIEKTPETFPELLEVCAKLKESGVNPMTCDQGDGTALLMGYQLARYIGQDALLEVVENKSWAEVPEVKKAAEDIYSLFSNGYMSEYAPAKAPDGANELGYGESAMLLQASWVPNEIAQNTGAEIDWGFFPWPEVEGGVDGIEASMVGAQGFGIVDKSEHKQEAFDFIMSVVTGENDLKMAEAVSAIPSDTANTQWPASVAGAEPYFKNMTKTYLWAVGLQENVNYKDYIQQGVDQLCNMEITPDEFVSQLAGM
ncbi:extracellular solute-binding protein [Fournierella sp.]|uniref:ABC transporter substrate-binding protein n=1 Tax=Allofournierella sp. TaxID=1940256 RepID=UPI0025C3997D|nr:extracellular solute-binding protein [Fournierella sp.]